MRARHTFKLLVTGPCATATAALLQSVSRTEVVATTLPSLDADGAATTTTIGIATCGVSTRDVGEVKLVLLGVRGRDLATPLLAVLAEETDAVCLVVDAAAPHTHAVASALLRHQAVRSRPFVVAVHGAPDDASARRLVRSLGVVPGARVVGCQLGNAESGRDVVVFALESLLSSLEGARAGSEVA